jgi:Tol biopolymer transport system component
VRRRLALLSLARTLALGAGILAAGVAAEASFPGDNGQIVAARPGQPLLVMDPDGSDPRPLHADSTGAMFPRWSPEGNRIAAVLNGDLVVLRANGQLLRTLTSHGDVLGAPSWSPEGTRLAYTRANGELWVVSATTGGNGTAVALPAPAAVVSAAWSPYPSSAGIAYTDGGAIFQVDPDSGVGGELAPAGPNGRVRSELSWHPRGVYLLDTSTASDGTTWVESQAGTYLIEPTDRSGVWSPDGNRVLFTRGGVLTLYDVAGATATPLRLSALTPDWQPRLVAPAAVIETDTGTTLSFRIRAPNEIPVTASFATVGGSATDGIDYQGTSGSVLLGADPFGQLPSIPVSIIGDTDPEQDESFYLELTFPSDPAEPLRVRGKILDDDGGTALNGLIAYTTDRGATVIDPVFGQSDLLFPSPASNPVFSPAGDRVAYVTFTLSGNSQMVIADANGTTMTTFNSGVDDEVHWSPDGARIVWTDGSTLWVADPASASSATAILGDARTPSWSSDTVGPRRLAFARPSTGQVCTVREDGTGVSCPTTGYQPRWSPDNSTIAFLRSNVTLFLMNPDGSNLRPVTFLTGTLFAEAVVRWSPRDGFLGLMTGNTLIVRQELGPQTTVSGLPPDLRDFDWSPDGHRLVVQGTDPAMIDSDLWVVGPDEAGTPLASAEQLTGPGKGTGVSSPRWSTAPARPAANLVSQGGIENFGNVRLEVELSGPALETVTLDWETIDIGSATAGVDFVPVAGDTVTIPPGETHVPILVTVLDDALYEGNEFFRVRLSTPSGARLGPDSDVLAMITDDELPPNRPPVAVDDVATTALDTPVDIAVLANDTDPDGDVLTLVSVGVPAHGTATFTGGVVTYTPQTGVGGVDHFLYTISDGNGHAVDGAVSVYVNVPLPPPAVLTVTPSFLDFGQVPLNKTKDLVLTITNNTPRPVALAEVMRVTQGNPQPFDASSFDGCRAAGSRILDPGASCTQTVRFWSVPGAGAASPASMSLLDGNTFATIAVVALFASTGPPDTGPNAPPVAVDDLATVLPGFTHTLDSTRNDSDPDHDLLRIVAVSDPPHGTATVIPCNVFPLNPNADCIQYVADAGYVGLDAVEYTISDGRGGTATATYHLAVGNVVPIVASITPSSGPTSGGQAVHITGSNFLYRSDVAFLCAGVVVPLNVTQLTDNDILATTPPGFAGTCDLRVRTLFGQTGQLANAYRYATNTPPVAQDGSASTDAGTPVTITLVATDADGDPLTYAIVTGPAHGTLSGIAPNLSYTPAAGYSGPDSFTFTANDGSADSNVATVSITVNAVDHVAPTVTINQAPGQADPTNASPISFSVVFSEPVTGFSGSDVSFAGSTVGGTLVASVTASGASYNVAVTGMSGTGAVVASIPAGAVHDLAGNPSLASTSTDNTVFYDGVAPMVTINQAPGQADPTNASPIVFTVTFSEPVTGFDAGDISLAGSTVGGTLSVGISGSGTSYMVSVTGMSGSGAVVASIPAGAVHDLAGNPSLASTSTDNTVFFDGVAPMVTINQAAGQADPTNGSPIVFTATFSEAVTGFDAGDISLAGSTVGGALAVSVSGSGLTYTVSVTGMSGSGVVVASIPAGAVHDLAGNPSLASTRTDNTVFFDGVAPTVTINQAAGQPDPTNASPIRFNVVFSEPVTGFGAADVSLAGSTVGGTLVAGVTGSGANYTVSVTGMSGSGSVVASIPAGAAQDSAGNASAASTRTDNTVFFDGVASTVTINQAAGQSDPTSGTTINFTVVFSEPVTGLSGSDVSFAGSTVGGILVANVTGSGASYNVAVTGMSGTGTVVASIPAGAAQDAAGNASTASTSTDNSVTVTITLTRPDLLEILVWAPNSGRAGSPVLVTDLTANTGSGMAGASNTRFYLSTNPTFDAGDRPLALRSIGSLPSGGVSPGFTVVVIPNGTAPGNYYLIAVADADGVVVESNEANNVSARAFRVQ